MSYKIFGDSCLDLTEELKKDPRFEMIPLTLQVDDHMMKHLTRRHFWPW